MGLNDWIQLIAGSTAMFGVYWFFAFITKSSAKHWKEGHQQRNDKNTKHAH